MLPTGAERPPQRKTYGSDRLRKGTSSAKRPEGRRLQDDAGEAGQHDLGNCGDGIRTQPETAQEALSTCDEMSEEMKQIDTGGLSFAELRKEDKYYVDKTLLIRDVLNSNNRGVYLFTRPRRFGKTTNLTMLDAFFNEKYKGNTWFDGLEISKYPEYEKFKNAFPVIRLNLNDTKASTYESFVNKLRDAVADAFEPHRYILDRPDLTNRTRNLFESVDDGSISDDSLETSIKNLSSAIWKATGKKPVILIDEYDCAVSDNFGKETHRDILDSLGRFLRSTLKTNENVEMAYLTGVMQIAKESIFSGLNNLKVNNIFSTKSDERFGFTEAEVREILEYYGHPEKLDEVREWYDGYRFGDAEVYNPFSIMNYVGEDCRPKTYWANSGGDGIVKDLLRRINRKNMDLILNLAAGNTVQAELAEAMAYDDVDSSDKYLLSLMAMTGYLNAVPIGSKQYEISIPNNEVMDIVRSMADTIRPISSDDFVKFYNAVLDCDAETIESVLEDALDSLSYFNLSAKVPENPYEVMVATLLFGICERYVVKTQREMKLGRSDIAMFPKFQGDAGVIFELKIAGSENEMDAGLDEAMNQIHDRRYFKDMPPGKVSLIGLCFYSKLVKVRTESVVVPVG